MVSGLDLVLTFDRLLSKRLLKMSMKTHRCSSMLSVGATLCLAATAREKVSMVSLEILSIRNRCLPRSIYAACRREL